MKKDPRLGLLDRMKTAVTLDELLLLRKVSKSYVNLSAKTLRAMDRAYEKRLDTLSSTNKKTKPKKVN